MLDDRKSAILRAVVQKYIETAQPVGSTHVADHPEIGVSPATIRNEMTTLEDEGYLVQPHTSAGRIPTEKGYRFFVDDIEPHGLDRTRARTVSEFFAHAHGELEEMLQSTSHLLSRLTATAAVVVDEPHDHATVVSVQLVGLSLSSYVAVAVLSNGDVVKRTMERTEDVTDEHLALASAQLTATLAGEPVASLAAVDDPGDSVAAGVAAEVTSELATLAASDAGRAFVDGASNIAGALESSSALQEVLGILERQITVVTLVRDVLDRGLTVAIGSETGVEPLTECSLVLAPYEIAGTQAGTIGVLGPTRMNYEEAVAAVAVVSQRLGKLLTEG